MACIPSVLLSLLLKRQGRFVQGPQASPVVPGMLTQKASDAYAMRYADVDALLCAAAWAKLFILTRIS